MADEDYCINSSINIHDGDVVDCIITKTNCVGFGTDNCNRPIYDKIRAERCPIYSLSQTISLLKEVQRARLNREKSMIEIQLSQAKEPLEERLQAIEDKLQELTSK